MSVQEINSTTIDPAKVPDLSASPFNGNGQKPLTDMPYLVVDRIFEFLRGGLSPVEQMLGMPQRNSKESESLANTCGYIRNIYKARRWETVEISSSDSLVKLELYCRWRTVDLSVTHRRNFTKREKNPKLFNQLMSSFVESCPALVQLEIHNKEGWLAGVSHPTMTRLLIERCWKPLTDRFRLPNLAYLNLHEGLDDERFTSHDGVDMLTSKYLKSLLQVHLGSEPNQTRLSNLYIVLTPFLWKPRHRTAQATQPNPLATNWFRRNLSNLEVASLNMNIRNLEHSFSSLQRALEDIGKEMTSLALETIGTVASIITLMLTVVPDPDWQQGTDINLERLTSTIPLLLANYPKVRCLRFKMFVDQSESYGERNRRCEVQALRNADGTV